MASRSHAKAGEIECHCCACDNAGSIAAVPGWPPCDDIVVADLVRWPLCDVDAARTL